MWVIYTTARYACHPVVPTGVEGRVGDHIYSWRAPLAYLRPYGLRAFGLPIIDQLHVDWESRGPLEQWSPKHVVTTARPEPNSMLRDNFSIFRTNSVPKY